MKIVYAGTRFNSYDPQGGHTFEFQNFLKTFQAMPGVEVFEHPFDRILEVGKDKYNEELFELVSRVRPEMLFVFMYTDELDPATLDRIKNETKTKTVAWFADDYWRFFNYSKRWAPHFSNVVTTYSKAVDWYRAAGFSNVILSQWACNTATYRPVDVPKDIDVSFVGQRKSGRAVIVDALTQAGVSVECYGAGWEKGRVSQEEMLAIFSRSKISLNLTDRKSVWDPSVLARIFLRKSITRIVPDSHLIDNFQAWRHCAIPHTHARPFELAGCGTFVISGWSEDVGHYYRPDAEMVFYRNPDELAEKVGYYLRHDKEREAIAQAGFLRTMKEHTYEARFKKIINEIGIKNS